MAATQLYRLGSDGLIHQPGARRSAKTGLWVAGQYEPHLAGLGTPFADVGPRVKRSDCTVVATDPFPVTNGSVYTKIDFRGRLSFPAITTGAVFVDCYGAGSYPTTGDGGILDGRAGAGVDGARWEFLHSALRPDSPNAWTNGAIGHHFRFFNCLFRDVVDGVGSYNTNGPNTQNEVYGCYFDRSIWYSPDPTGDHADSTHNDTGCQHQGGVGLWFVGNAVHGYVKDRTGNIKTLPNPNGSAPNYNQSGQGVIVQQNVEASSDIHINKNWFYGCGSPIKLISAGGLGNVEAVGNRWMDFGARDFGGSQHYYWFRFDAGCSVNGVSYVGGNNQQLSPAADDNRWGVAGTNAFNTVAVGDLIHYRVDP
jgi:hypothetical protein